MEYLTASLLSFFSTKLKAVSIGLRSELREGTLNCTAPILCRAVLTTLEF